MPRIHVSSSAVAGMLIIATMRTWGIKILQTLLAPIAQVPVSMSSVQCHQHMICLAASVYGIDCCEASKDHCTITHMSTP